MDMNERIDKLENRVSEIEKCYFGIKGDLNLIIYKLDEQKERNAIADVDFATRWSQEYAKQQSIRSKVVRGMWFGVGVILTTIITILTGVAELIGRIK